MIALVLPDDPNAEEEGIMLLHAPSPNDTPAMTIPMIKSSFGFVIIVSYLFLFLLS
jgi:hypothetical protein